MSSELQALHSRWADADDGNDMPEDIASQPIDVIRKAVKWREQGITVVVPREQTAIIEQSEIVDWDRQDEKNGNAY